MLEAGLAGTVVVSVRAEGDEVSVGVSATAAPPWVAFFCAWNLRSCPGSSSQRFVQAGQEGTRRAELETHLVAGASRLGRTVLRTCVGRGSLVTWDAVQDARAGGRTRVVHRGR